LAELLNDGDFKKMDFIYYLLLVLADKYRYHVRDSDKYYSSYLLSLIAGTYYASFILIIVVLLSPLIKGFWIKYLDIESILAAAIWIGFIIVRYISEKRVIKVKQKFKSLKLNNKYFLIIMILIGIFVFGLLLMGITGTIYNKVVF
jgi:hypothetical protein